MPKDSTITATLPASKGKAIGAQTSTTHSNYAEKHLADTELKLYPTADEYKLDVSNGRIDAVIDDVVVLSEWVKSRCRLLLQDPDDRCRSINEINGNGAGIAVRKGESAEGQAERRDRRDPRQRQVQEDPGQVLRFRRLRRELS